MSTISFEEAFPNSLDGTTVRDWSFDYKNPQASIVVPSENGIQDFKIPLFVIRWSDTVTSRFRYFEFGSSFEFSSSNNIVLVPIAGPNVNDRKNISTHFYGRHVGIFNEENVDITVKNYTTESVVDPDRIVYEDTTYMLQLIAPFETFAYPTSNYAVTIPINGPEPTFLHLNPQPMTFSIDSSYNNVVLTSKPDYLPFTFNNVPSFDYKETFSKTAYLTDITDPNNIFISFPFEFDSFYVGNVTNGTALEYAFNLVDVIMVKDHIYRLHVPHRWVVSETGLLNKEYAGDNALYTFTYKPEETPEPNPEPDPTPSEPAPSDPTNPSNPVVDPTPTITIVPNEANRPPKNIGRNVGALIGAIIGGVVLIVIILVYVFRKRIFKKTKDGLKNSKKQTSYD